MSARDILKSIPTLKKNEINILKPDHPYTALYNTIDELTPNEIIVRPSCKFCHHPQRQLFEEEFEKCGRANLAKVERAIREYEKNNPTIIKLSFSCIKRHLQQHYILQEKQIQQKEYAQKHSLWINKKMGDEQKLEATKAAMEMLFFEIASDDTLFILKKAEAMAKLGKSLVDIMTMQGKLRGEIDGVQVLKDKLITAWTSLIQSQNDDGVRRAIMGALEQFQEDINGTGQASVEVV